MQNKGLFRDNEKDFQQELKERLRKIREEKAYTQEKFSKLMGISLSTLKKYENPNESKIPAFLLKKYHNILRIHYDELFGEPVEDTMLSEIKNWLFSDEKSIEKILKQLYDIKCYLEGVQLLEAIKESAVKFSTEIGEDAGLLESQAYQVIIERYSDFLCNEINDMFFELKEAEYRKLDTSKSYLYDPKFDGMLLEDMISNLLDEMKNLIFQTPIPAHYEKLTAIEKDLNDALKTALIVEEKTPVQQAEMNENFEKAIDNLIEHGLFKEEDRVKWKQWDSDIQKALSNEESHYLELRKYISKFCQTVIENYKSIPTNNDDDDKIIH